MNKEKFAVHAPTARASSEVPTLAEIAATTDTTYSAARFAPKDYEDLRAQATDAYDSGDLKKEFYPPKQIKEYHANKKGWEWRKWNPTPADVAAWRHRAILRLMRIARLGAALGYLPEVSWENIYVFDGATIVGAHFMKGAILALPSCVEWSDEEITVKETVKLDNGTTQTVERVVGYKMTVRRMLPSGQIQKTLVQAYLSEFAHLFDGEDGKLVWKQYGADMIYAACVRRAANHAFPDRVRGMGTKEEAAVMRHSTPHKAEAPIATPGIDSLLEAAVDDLPPDPFAPMAAPPASTTEAAQSEPKKAEPTKEEYNALLALLPTVGESVTNEEIAALWNRIEAFSDMAIAHGKLRALFAANGNLNPAQVPS